LLVLKRSLPFALAAALLAYAAFVLMADLALPLRAVLLRYLLAIAAPVCAVMPPHVLLPDRGVRFLQLLNPSPADLLRRQLARWAPVVLVLAVPLGVLGAWGGPPDTAASIRLLHVVEALLLMVGLALYAFLRYVTIGEVSQGWQEGSRGGGYRRLLAHLPQFQLAVPDGLVPAVTVTGRIFVVGAVAVMASLLLGAAAALPGLALLAWSGFRLAGASHRYDQHFYGTSAFYAEVLRESGGIRATQRPAIAFEAVWWTPRRWRPSTWISLVQLDRRLPLGRLVAVAVIILYLMLLQGAGPAAIAGLLIVFIVVKNSAVYLLTLPEVAPPAFQLAVQPSARWAIARGFVNLRWTLPLLLTLFVASLIFPNVTLSDALAWAVLDAVAAFLFAGLFTYLAEGRYARRYA
jgi:hypothetical protein